MKEIQEYWDNATYPIKINTLSEIPGRDISRQHAYMNFGDLEPSIQKRIAVWWLSKRKEFPNSWLM